MGKIKLFSGFPHKLSWSNLNFRPFPPSAPSRFDRFSSVPRGRFHPSRFSSAPQVLIKKKRKSRKNKIKYIGRAWEKGRKREGGRGNAGRAMNSTSLSGPNRYVQHVWLRLPSTPTGFWPISSATLDVSLASQFQSLMEMNQLHRLSRMLN